MDNKFVTMVTMVLQSRGYEVAMKLYIYLHSEVYRLQMSHHPCRKSRNYQFHHLSTYSRTEVKN